MREEDLYIHCPNCTTKLEIRIIDDKKYKVCPKCPFVFWNNPKPSVSIILSHENKVLMLQRARQPFVSYWVLPGGYLDYDEEIEEAIIRETKEETGFELAIDGLVGVYRTPEEPRGVDIDIIFFGTSDKKEPQINQNEHKDWKYFSEDGLPEQIAYRHRQAIQDWFTKGRQYS